MSPEPTPPNHPPAPQPTPQPAPEIWEPLTPEQRRVLGVLVEKQKTSRTADAYPLTLNALTLGCNQKSNRDPVMDLADGDVEEILTPLQRKGLVMRMTGSRVDRFRHQLYEAWRVSKLELAVLAELLLRGPQTKGELRGRVSRMDPLDTLDALEEVLKPLVARRLVVYLNDPDRRGAVLTHGFHTPDELARLKVQHPGGAEPELAPAHVPTAASAGPGRGGSSSGPLPPTAPAPSALAALEARVTEAVGEIGRLKAALAALESQVADLRNQLGLEPGAA